MVIVNIEHKFFMLSANPPLIFRLFALLHGDDKLIPAFYNRIFFGGFCTCAHCCFPKRFMRCGKLFCLEVQLQKRIAVIKVALMMAYIR